mmetsp:Transcript_48968/g.98115  ORF Transcript_48968/g.98115 Transcript_48968/m.98115 type:complete len:268 (+) Transcript_48968:225-1028(+)
MIESAVLVEGPERQCPASALLECREVAIQWARVLHPALGRQHFDDGVEDEVCSALQAQRAPAEAQLAVLGLGQPIQAVHLRQLLDGQQHVRAARLLQQAVQQILLLHRRPLCPHLLRLLGLAAHVVERNARLELGPRVGNALDRRHNRFVELWHVRRHSLRVEPLVPLEAVDLVAELGDGEGFEVLRGYEFRLELLDVGFHKTQERLLSDACLEGIQQVETLLIGYQRESIVWVDALQVWDQLGQRRVAAGNEVAHVHRQLRPPSRG